MYLYSLETIAPFLTCLNYEPTTHERLNQTRKNMNFEDIPIELLLKIIYYCVPLSTTNYATHLRRDANPLSRAWAKEKEAQVLGNIHHKKDLRNPTLVTLSCVNKNLRRLCLPVLFRNIICYNEDHLRNFQKSFISSVQEYTK